MCRGGIPMLEVGRCGVAEAAGIGDGAARTGWHEMG
jgi:hypothetical protein